MNLNTPDFAERIADPAVLDALFEHLHEAKARMSEGEWRGFCDEVHGYPEVQEIVLQDPMTRRAYLKPRGYAGDAVMMDYLYGIHSSIDAAATATDTGRAILGYIQDRPSGRGVRFRREHIAELIDATAAETPCARVLSVACGHLREAELSLAVASGSLGRFVAMDGDVHSLSEVEDCYATLGVETLHGTVRHLLARKCCLPQFDFVYASGLYDYLADKVAAALTERLFELTAPGGTLVIPNFAPEVADRAYMEAVMDWQLIYRDEYDMSRLIESLDARLVNDYDIYRDPTGSIVFLVIRKR